MIAALHNQIPLPSANATTENLARSMWNPVLVHFGMEALACICKCLSNPFESLSVGPCGKIFYPHLSTVNQREHTHADISEEVSPRRRAHYRVLAFVKTLPRGW